MSFCFCFFFFLKGGQGQGVYLTQELASSQLWTSTPGCSDAAERVLAFGRTVCGEELASYESEL